MTLSVVHDLRDGVKLVALKDIKLDPTNVRFRHITKPMTEKEIEEQIYNEEDVRTIEKQISLQGGVMQPLYVKQDGDKYIVKEGNRRIVALRRLSRDVLLGKLKGYDKDHFNIVPVVVLTGTDREIDLQLATMHVSGPKDWVALNKGGLIYDFVEKYGEKFEDLSAELGMPKTEVIKYYNAFKATTLFGKRFSEDAHYVHKFSYFFELYGKRSLKNWLDEDQARLDKFSEWVAKGKMSQSYRGVRLLAKILNAPSTKRAQALDILDSNEGDVDKGYTFLTGEGASVKVGPWKELETVLKTLKRLPFEEYLSALQDESKQNLIEDIAVFATEMKERIREAKNRKEHVSA